MPRFFEYDLSAGVEGLWVRLVDVVELVEDIAKGVGFLMADLDSKYFDHKFNLCRLPGQKLDREFGPLPDAMSSMTPVLRIASAAGKLNGPFLVVADQSCLSLFVNELSASIDAVAA